MIHIGPTGCGRMRLGVEKDKLTAIGMELFALDVFTSCPSFVACNFIGRLQGSFQTTQKMLASSRKTQTLCNRICKQFDGPKWCSGQLSQKHISPCSVQWKAFWSHSAQVSLYLSLKFLPSWKLTKFDGNHSYAILTPYRKKRFFSSKNINSFACGLRQQLPRSSAYPISGPAQVIQGRQPKLTQPHFHFRTLSRLQTTSCLKIISYWWLASMYLQNNMHTATQTTESW